MTADLRCRLCGRYLNAKEAARRGSALFHAECLADVEKQELAAKARRDGSTVSTVSITAGFLATRVERDRAGLPNWPWARFGNDDFRLRASPRLLSVLKRWSPQRGNLVLSAPTGRGKTAGLVAWANRAHSSESAPVVAFVSGLELAGARRRARLGEEAETVERALRCDVLFLDELGFEPSSEEPFFVIDWRYRAGHPTVVTTGLRPAAFRERYGDALWRRLAEGGAVVEDFHAGTGG